MQHLVEMNVQIVHIPTIVQHVQDFVKLVVPVDTVMIVHMAYAAAVVYVLDPLVPTVETQIDAYTGP